MGQENVYFGTEPLNTGTWSLAFRRGSAIAMAASWTASTNHTCMPWMATMTKGDHMAAVLRTGTPQGVRAPARGKQ